MDPDGDFIMAIIVGAAIGAAISGGSTIVMNLAAGHDWDKGLGRSLAFGAVAGGIGAGLGAAFAGTAFGHSTSFGIINNMASTVSTNAIFGNDFTAGTLIGGIAGGLVRGQLPAYSGVNGGSIVNGLGEIFHMAGTGAVSGAVTGGEGAIVDGKSIRHGILSGTMQGSLGGASQAGLNILLMGTTYVPDQSYGDFGEFEPVYRRGNIITRHLMQGSGIALGRNLITNQFNSKTAEKWRIDGADYNDFLRAHETAHFAQQRELGFGGFYGRTLSEYLKFGMRNVYNTPETLEFHANRFAFNRLGYYYRSLYNRRTRFP